MVACLPCLGLFLVKVALFSGKVAVGVCGNVCKKVCTGECHEGVMSHASNNLPHHVHTLIWAVINACMVVWQYFYVFRASIQPYDYRLLIFDLSDDIDSLTVILIFYMIVINGWFIWVAVIHRRNYHIVYLIVKLVISFLLTIGYFIVPFVVLPVVWESQFKDTCNGFGTMINLDVSAKVPATAIEFYNYNSDQKYLMEFQPNPQESNDEYK
jgi:hypothetical protein